MSPIRAALEVTQARIDAYGRANGDDERMHYDAAWARSLGFRGTIAHGTLLAAPLVDLALRRFGPAFLSRGTLQVRWVSPVCAGDLQVATIDEDGNIEAVNEHLPGRPATILGRARCGAATP